MDDGKWFVFRLKWVARCPHTSVMFFHGPPILAPNAWGQALLYCLNCAGARVLPGGEWMIPIEVDS